MGQLSRPQRIGLVVLRTVIGWHFLYEGYYKLMLPGWTRDGQPNGAWSAASYLGAATGPLAGLFRWLGESRWIGWVDTFVPIALMAIGLALMLGLFTQAACWGALAFLALFYLSALPLAGRPVAGAEGAYLIVSKNLIEWCAVLVVHAFRTGEIAGLDRLRRRGPFADTEGAATAGMAA